MTIFAGLEHIVRENEPIAKLTWFCLGGPARYYAEPTSREELASLLRRSQDANLPVRILGGGSNVLVRDEGFPGLVIHLSAPAFSSISTNGQLLAAGGGAQLSHVISVAVREGLSGLESLVGIPGTLGGALRTNASANGFDIGQCTRRVSIMMGNGEVLTSEGADLGFAYRQSGLEGVVVLGADLELEREDPVTVTKRMQKLWILQKSNQPQGNVNASCVFHDVGGISAASLIEQAGLRSAQVGQASVSEVNANFIVALPQARSRDVIELIDRLRNGVADRLGISLETGLQIW